MQSRRSLLIWKLYGKRLDGWDNDDFPYEATPGDPGSLRQHGKPVSDAPKNRNLAHIGYTGGVMPPPEAVAGTYVAPDGRKVKVPGLTDISQYVWKKSQILRYGTPKRCLSSAAIVKTTGPKVLPAAPSASDVCSACRP